MKMSQTRESIFRTLFPQEPSFRWRQISRALFDVSNSDWESVTTLSLDMRMALEEQLPWTSLRAAHVLESRRKDTVKALLECADGARVETVLMKNRRGHWSVCVSSQVGCAMRCEFCATGALGFSRNLSSDEIVDQYRFWNSFLARRVVNGESPEYISNIVFMGMGEPLANYESVREAICSILSETSIGPTRITVSTVGLLPALRNLLNDSLWPPVRLAVSLHSADRDIRQSIMPSTSPEFFDELAGWANEYFRANPSRRRHLTFEYVLLGGVNDNERDMEKLVRFSRCVGKVRINLIPYNATGSRFSKSGREQECVVYLKRNGIPVTLRRTMGDDIAAACGQLAGERECG